MAKALVPNPAFAQIEASQTGLTGVAEGGFVVSWKAEERTGAVEIVAGQRVVRIPDDFVLIGKEIVIRQEKDGVITIHPATAEGRKALEKFTPFGDWTEEDLRRSEAFDWSTFKMGRGIK